MLELTLRLVFSLAVVVGLLLLLARLGAKRFSNGPEALVQVVHRQALSRTASVSVVTVGSKVLVLGTTEHQVSLLTELDPEELVSDEVLDEVWNEDGSAQPGISASLGHRTPTQPTMGGLSGSVLSPDTWKQAWSSVTNTIRKNP